MSTRYSSLKRITRNTFIIFVLLLLLLHPTGTARAASYTAGTFTELETAITIANGNSEADTITLTADITLTGALPQITSSYTLTIEGAGHTLDGAGAYRVLYVNLGNLIINNLTITNGNVSGAYGGGFYNNSSIVTINNCTISNNSATGDGGGLYNFGNTTINNSTFSGNSSRAWGGGVRNDAGTLTINNSSISGNSAGAMGGGGGIANTATLTLNRNIISGNSVTGPRVVGVEIVNYGSITSNYNVLGYSGLTNAQAYEYFTPNSITDYNATSDGGHPTALANILNTTLANNGGPTLTHALISGSPAIDLAPSAECTASPISGIDQRGAARNYNGSGSTGDYECDSGAYELHQSVLNGTCSGPGLSGTQTFAFASGNTVTINVSIPNGLNCITVEEMGPGTNHIMATGPGSGGETLQTNNWWHISGNATGFTVSITLPYATPDGYTRVCKWPGNLGGAGWDCDNGTYTTPGTTSVTRTNIQSFSDWAVGQGVGPTAITLYNFNARSGNPWVGAGLAISVLAAGFLIILLLVRIRKQAHG